jgi:hypothetical protein
MGAPEVEASLTHLAVKENIAVSTQNQARSALLAAGVCGWFIEGFDTVDLGEGTTGRA